MKIFAPVLGFLERHVIGILTTIALHLFIITVFLVIKMRTQDRHQDAEVLIDFSQPEVLQKQIEDLQQQVKTQPKQEFIDELKKQYNVRNVAVNEADQDARKSIDNMVNDIKDELNINGAVRDTSNTPKIDPIKEKKAKEVKQDKSAVTFNEKGEPTFFKGNTTISYFLKGRTHLYIPVPVYKCEGGGKVVVDIAVNPRGYVLDARVNRDESQITEDCLVDAATRAALVTRFNEKSDAPARQEGKITFIFVAQ